MRPPKKLWLIFSIPRRRHVREARFFRFEATQLKRGADFWLNSAIAIKSSL